MAGRRDCLALLVLCRQTISVVDHIACGIGSRKLQQAAGFTQAFLTISGAVVRRVHAQVCSACP